jgi:hypothetical protein
VGVNSGLSGGSQTKVLAHPYLPGACLSVRHTHSTIAGETFACIGPAGSPTAHRVWFLLAHCEEKQSMNRLQWLADAEIDRLEKLYEQPSPETKTASVVIQERLTALEKVRTPGNTAGH